MKTESTLLDILYKAGINVEDLLLISNYNKIYLELIREDITAINKKIAVLNLLSMTYSEDSINRLKDLLEHISSYNSRSNHNNGNPKWTELEVTLLCYTLYVHPFNIQKNLEYVTKLLHRRKSSALNIYNKNIKTIKARMNML